MLKNSSTTSIGPALTPRHVGIIMDGNRRWASANGKPSFSGHSQGAAQIEPVARALFDEGVEYLSLFLFSEENWKRTKDEVGYLMDLFVRYFKKDAKRIIADGFRIRFAGRRDDRVSAKILRLIDELESSSENNTGGTVVFCFNYSGESEMVDAYRKIAESGIDASKVDVEVLKKNLYNPDIPDCDLVVRTSGEQRMSGFNLLRTAYAELYFTDKHWPDFGPDDARIAISDFEKRNRRFGGN